MPISGILALQGGADFKSKALFKKHVQFGDDPKPLLLELPGGSIADHWSFHLMDGNTIDVYAPDGKIQSAYVDFSMNAKSNSPIEWLIHKD